MNGAPAVLCVDAGNSFIKFAIMGAKRELELASCPTPHSRLPRTPALERLKRRRARLDGVVVSSVVPSVDRSLARTLERLTGHEPLFVDHTFHLPFSLAVRRPAEVGIDRICAAAGAAGRRDSGVIVIDIGSAITVDLVDRGEYLGGLIVAGPQLGLRALGAFAQQLPTIDYEAESNPFPARRGGTRASMLRGASEGAVGAIARAVRVLEGEAGRRLRKVVTGGAAKPLMRRFPASWRHDPRLVHRGLHKIWKTNC